VASVSDEARAPERAEAAVAGLARVSSVAIEPVEWHQGTVVYPQCLRCGKSASDVRLRQPTYQKGIKRFVLTMQPEMFCAGCESFLVGCAIDGRCVLCGRAHLFGRCR
jgi:hypothetical protein